MPQVPMFRPPTLLFALALMLLIFALAIGGWVGVGVGLGSLGVGAGGAWTLRAEREREAEASARERALDELEVRVAEQSRTVDTLADGLDAALFICDTRGTILYANPPARRLFGNESPVDRRSSGRRSASIWSGC